MNREIQQLYFENAKLIDLVSVIEKNGHYQNYVDMTSNFINLIRKLPGFIERILLHLPYFEQCGCSFDADYIVGILGELASVQEQEDYVLLVDLAKLRLLPFLIDIQTAIHGKEGFFFDETIRERNLSKLKEKDPSLYRLLSRQYEREVSAVDENTAAMYVEYGDDQNVYSVEHTTSGDFTLAVSMENQIRYMHSNDNPIMEARQFANYYYDVEKDNYLLFGLGLSYQGKAVFEKDRDMRLTIVETDIGVICQAFTFVDMSWYLDNRDVTIKYDESYETMKQMLKEQDCTLLIHKPSVFYVRQDNMREILNEVMMRDGLARKYETQYYQNSKVNFALCDGYVDELRPLFENKKIIIVAGGPSLDKNVELLKKRREDTIIFAVGAVFKKLLQIGCPIDYVIITDQKDETVRQISGVENQQVPLLLMSTATREVAKRYKGKKYLICQNGYARAEKYAKEHGYTLYETGGSVATTALELSISFGAASITTVGLDLAFTGNKAHADDSGNQDMSIAEEMIPIPSYDGGTVYTSRPFHMFRKWIEDRVMLQDVTMPIYNATEGGAYIKGMKHITLNEVLSL